jgi:hypothetical protein
MRSDRDVAVIADRAVLRQGRMLLFRGTEAASRRGGRHAPAVLHRQRRARGSRVSESGRHCPVVHIF